MEEGLRQHRILIALGWLTLAATAPDLWLLSQFDALTELIGINLAAPCLFGHILLSFGFFSFAKRKRDGESIGRLNEFVLAALLGIVVFCVYILCAVLISILFTLFF